ncbi:hypothetical protein N1851_012927 [Merluccius polli]|uniref:Reverse transcriptase n=1 Tax=Merluccius polli TaxID=89951 RepID=A0AA47MWV3_MERPO|nr:hypothetical protein N1851_012927 [Merluccius polli]
MTTIIVSMAAERFGVEEERGAKQPYTKNQRADASEEEHAPLAELDLMLRKRLLILHRAEQHRRRRRERATKRTAFINNPRRKSTNTFTTPSVTPPETKTRGVRGWCHSERSSGCGEKRCRSAPGTSYRVYKHCPKLLHQLWRIWRIWRRGKTAQQWQFAEGVWIPKENSKNISQFRIISLLIVEVTDFSLKNKYIDTSEQKGGIPGSITGLVTQLLREAKNRGDLVVLWLDLANAYGSMPLRPHPGL